MNGQVNKDRSPFEGKELIYSALPRSILQQFSVFAINCKCCRTDYGNYKVQTSH